jgi:hypothetical protein
MEASDSGDSEDNDAPSDYDTDVKTPADDDPDAADDDTSDDINEDRDLTCFFYNNVRGFNKPASLTHWTDQGLERV